MEHHIIIDGHDGNATHLGDIAVAQALVPELVRTLGMTLAREPLYEPAEPEGDLLGGGVTALAMITESHIAIHTAPASRSVWADIFSCKPFDPEVVRLLFERTYGLARMRLAPVERDIGDYVVTRAGAKA